MAAKRLCHNRANRKAMGMDDETPIRQIKSLVHVSVVEDRTEVTE